MICDDPDSCSSCDEIRVLPWVQDVPQVYDPNYDEEACLYSGYSWQLADQIIYSDMDQSTCLSNGYTWNEDFMMTCLLYTSDAADE